MVGWQSGRYAMDQPTWDEVSPLAQNLVEQLLCFDPARRLSAAEALKHPWITSEGEGRETPLYNAASAMRAFNSHRKIKKAVLGIMAQTLESDELGDLKQLFEEADQDKDGFLEADEVRAIIDGAGYDMAGMQLAQMLDEVDTSKEGKVNLNEFVAAGMQRSLYLKEENMRKTFDWLDVDGTGLISRQELQQALGCSDVDVEEMMKEADTNGDGMIEWSEFKSVMSDRHLQRQVTALPDGSLHLV